ncbi:DUF4167 domain-containing protein [Erythrobacter sp. WG]|uniref:DUF4167 domain-containing protein n=1 Tax=Erythrobacter sp. WG TaxID=2985510 RepID=UPI00226E7685|nr:DUF4167 domain-containing protein [Erythrobacter sp. WG]MCX9145802.1 DUF4167 domain-containing protein [Erythrobacter sp. WG]
MNNNRNNRRRGRGNRNQGGNGAQLNRIDSRARGNAPQMLDKYKKLAQDAQHNGDRVQMEYYLQFADHYFRVIADNKARQDEQRGGGQRRNDEREVDDFEDDFDFGRRSDAPARSVYEQQDSAPAPEVLEGEPGQEGEPFLAEDRGNERSDERPRGQRRQHQQRKPREAREGGHRDGDRNGPRSEKRGDRPERAEKAERPADHAEPKPARTRKPRKSADDGERSAGQGGIDSSILPPSIRGDDAGSGETGGALETVE